MANKISRCGVYSLCPRCHQHSLKSEMTRNVQRWYHAECLQEVLKERAINKAFKNYKRTLKDKVLYKLFGIPASVPVNY